jgi:2-polyprenyl-3-methyl-5-hydroxy-6-metoxy-1,4-benzoquinol methylase
LQALGRESWLYLPALAQERATTGGFFNATGFDKNWLIVPSGEGAPSREGAPSKEGGDDRLQNINWECIVLDRFQTPPDELARWTKLAPVIGIDEGGSSRNFFDFLIDILPNCEQVKPNLTDTSLLPLPEKPSRKSSAPTAPFKILVSFGREDAAGLGLATAHALAKKKIDGIEITLLQSGQTYSLVPAPHRPLSLLKQTCLSCNIGRHWGSQRADSSQETQLDAVLTPVALLPILGEYNLVITHYGLTAFEALYAGVPVLLVSPGAYHEKLAKAAGFCSLGVGKNKAKKLPSLLFRHGEINKEFIDKLQNRCTTLAVKYHLNNAPSQSLAELINSYAPIVSRNCPVCGTELCGPALARFPERSYYRCETCGVIGMNRLTPPPIEYDKEYFFDFYQRQYGKTYIEDFPNLIAMGKRRLAIIKSLLSENKTVNSIDNSVPTLLDIGCAYGPFLAAAKEEGFSPFGIDPSEDAINYVTQTLNIPAVQGFFPHSPLPPENSTRTGECVDEYTRHGVGQTKAAVTQKSEGPPTPHRPLSLLKQTCLSQNSSHHWGSRHADSNQGTQLNAVFSSVAPFSSIALWYVIEHFRDCVPVLAEIRKLLKPGGVLAFATPSFSGISGRSSFRRFLERSPADHWTIWSPSITQKALGVAGFQVKKIINSGHHPERFPLLGKFAQTKKSPLYWLLWAISTIFSLGDTFEIYAIKN